MIFAHLFQVASSSPIEPSALESSISALETAISALEAEIRALDSRSVPWEHALPWFTFAVLVGVAIEWWIIRHDFREERETWAIFDFIGVVRFPSRPSVLKLAVEITSIALIVFGIFGEIGIGLKIASINSSLRAKSAELRSKNAELRNDSDRLVALVNERAGRLEKEASEIEESVAPRRLTTKQRELLASHLRKFAGRSLTVFTDPSDAEAAVFASEIYLTLKSAKWNVDGSRNVGRGGERSMTVAPDLPATGVDVPCGPPKLHDAAGEALVRELSVLGFDSQCSTRATALWPLEVLARPEGPQGDAKLRAETEKKQVSRRQTTKP